MVKFILCMWKEMKQKSCYIFIASYQDTAFDFFLPLEMITLFTFKDVLFLDSSQKMQNYTPHPFDSYLGTDSLKLYNPSILRQIFSH